MISIVIPTFNRLLSLKECIGSVMSQYYDGLEVIIIDDFSSDSTRDYLLEVANCNFFIKVLLNSQNLGVNYSRNRGIEAATQDFILFLDSDDRLIEGSLKSMENLIAEYKQVSHFLFVISYRSDEFVRSGVREIYYHDWIQGKINGDFTHLVKSSILKRLLFFEQFRMFEYLNWLRVKKRTSPQLLFPIVTTIVDRDRDDSLSRATCLNTEDSVRSKFEAQHLFYTLFFEDLQLYNSSALKYKLIYSIILGIAVNEKRKSIELIQYSNYFLVKTAGRFIMFLPSNLTLRLITAYSDFKRYYKKILVAN